MSRLELSLLGAPRLQHGGQPITFATRKTLALLVYLAAEGTVQPREKLAGLLWPGSDGQRARAALRRTLAYLRDGLGPAEDHVRIEADALSLDGSSDVALDLHTVQAAWSIASQLATSARTGEPVDRHAHLDALHAAVACARGPFLDGFSLPDAPDFDTWASTQRQVWHQRVTLIFDQLTQIHFAAGQLAAARETAVAWVGHDALNEAAYRRLMHVSIAMGDRGAAMRAYDACRSMLRREFDAEPELATERLVARIRDATRARSPGRPDGHASHAGSPVLEGPLVGRAEEYARLVALYRAAQHGAGQAVVILGEAGIGKTRLAHDFADWAAANGADVLRARALEVGGRLPYQPLVQALRARLEGENAPDDLLSDVWLAELSRLLPELRERYPDLPLPVAGDVTAQPRLFEAMARLGESLARNRPLLLLVDDLQWADATSRDVLQYMAGRWAEAAVPALLLFTLRAPSGVEAPRVNGWLASLARSMPVTRIVLGQLSARDTSELLRALVRSEAGELDPTAGGGQADALSRWLFDETGGQPFFLLETIRALVERGVLALRRHTEGGWALDVTGVAGDVQRLRGFLAPGVREVVRARLDQLTPAALTLLAAGAVLGEGFPFDLLCEVAGLGELEGLSALDGVLASGLLRETVGEPGRTHGQRYFFSHDRIRDIVYEQAGAARRQVLHRRSLAALEARAAPAADKAHHARSAGLYQAAVGYGIAAGDEALDLFAVRDAISHYEQARQLLPLAFPGPGVRDVDVGARLHPLYEHLGRAYELAGETGAAHTIYQEMLATARQMTRPAMECEALNRLATLAAQAPADLASATTLLGQALQVAETSGDKTALAETAWNLAQLGIYGWTLGPAMTYGARALALAQEIGHAELIARCLNVIASAEVLAGQWTAAEGHAQDAQERYTQLGDRAMAADCLCLAAHAQLKLGRPLEARETAHAARASSGEIHNAWGQINSAHHLTLALLDLGRPAEAFQVAQASASLATSSGVPLLRVLAYVALGAARRALGALTGARATHLDAMAIVAEMGAPPFLTDFVAAELSADCAEAGDWSAALVYAQQALAARDGTFLAGGLTRWYETEALLRGGLEEAARADVARFGELIPDRGRHRIPYLRSQAVLAYWAGAPDRAADYLRSARTLAEEMGVPGEIGPIDRALAQLRTARGEVDAAP